MRCVLGAAMLATAVVAGVEVASSYSNPRVQITSHSVSSLEVPVIMFCPGEEHNVTGVTAASLDGRRWNTSYELKRGGRGEGVCHVFDLGYESTVSSPYRGADGIAVFATPRGETPLDFVVYLRWVRPTSIELVSAGGGDAVERVLPPDTGQIAWGSERAVMEAAGGGRGTVLTTLAMRLVAQERVSTAGAVTRRTAALAPVQVLDPVADGADEPVPDAYVFYRDLVVERHTEYVALGWLYFVGTVGGAFSVSKFVLYLYVTATRGSDSKGTVNSTPLLPA